MLTILCLQLVVLDWGFAVVAMPSCPYWCPHNVSFWIKESFALQWCMTGRGRCYNKLRVHHQLQLIGLLLCSPLQHGSPCHNAQRACANQFHGCTGDKSTPQPLRNYGVTWRVIAIGISWVLSDLSNSFLGVLVSVDTILPGYRQRKIMLVRVKNYRAISMLLIDEQRKQVVTSGM